MIINRVWAMVNKDTFHCKPIGEFVQKYLEQSTMSIDPFARNCWWATFTNDLDPTTKAQSHLDAREFLGEFISQGIKADLIILDPPYSQVQVSYVYKSVGREYKPFGDDNRLENLALLDTTCHPPNTLNRLLRKRIQFLEEQLNAKS